MRIIYDIIFLIFSIGCAPYFLIKRKYHRGCFERFGAFEKGAFSAIAGGRPIWLHAVSVGEMKTAESFLYKMRSVFPSRRFVISNITKTGHDIAVSIAKKEDTVIYFPMDLSFIVRKFVKFINPCLFISVETEIWPNLITELARKSIPAVLINGRISSKSFKGYRLAKPIIGKILGRITLFCMRTKKDAERIKALGAPAERIKVTGNMKFDSSFLGGNKDFAQVPAFINKDKWLSASSKLIVAGSTHRGEDSKILQSYKALKKDFSDLRLLIAPRHIERVEEISSMVERSGFKAVKISEIGKKSKISSANSVFILDSMGQLNSFYKLAAAVFMGGSLVPHGGHNLIEPAVYAKPIITGPYVHNFKDILELFAENGAVEVVHNSNELTNSLRNLLSDGARCKAMGDRAKRVVFENIGSTDKNISLIKGDVSLAHNP